LCGELSRSLLALYFPNSCTTAAAAAPAPCPILDVHDLGGALQLAAAAIPKPMPATRREQSLRTAGKPTPSGPGGSPLSV
jgi:hypothetical protein